MTLMNEKKIQSEKTTMRTHHGNWFSGVDTTMLSSNLIFHFHLPLERWNSQWNFRTPISVQHVNAKIPDTQWYATTGVLAPSEQALTCLEDGKGWHQMHRYIMILILLTCIYLLVNISLQALDFLHVITSWYPIIVCITTLQNKGGHHTYKYIFL